MLVATVPEGSRPAQSAPYMKYPIHSIVLLIRTLWYLHDLTRYPLDCYRRTNTICYQVQEAR